MAPTRSSLIGERAIAAAPHDLAREARGAALVAILPKHAKQLQLRRFVEPVGRGARRIVTHAHVERCALPEREPAPRIVELVGGDAKIEQDAVETSGIQLGHSGEISVVAQESAKAGGNFVVVQSRTRRGNRLRIAIERGDACALLQEQECMATATQRSVEHVRTSTQEVGNLAGENRRVVCARPPRLVRSQRGHSSGARSKRSSDVDHDAHRRKTRRRGACLHSRSACPAPREKSSCSSSMVSAPTPRRCAISSRGCATRDIPWILA